MLKHDEHVQDAKRGCGHDKEVDGNEVLDVVLEKRTPGLRRRLSPKRHVPAYAGGGAVDEGGCDEEKLRTLEVETAELRQALGNVKAELEAAQQELSAAHEPPGDSRRLRESGLHGRIVRPDL